MGHLMRAGDNVLIRMPSSNVKLVILKPKTIVSLGKFGSFFADDLIGKPFGLTFQVVIPSAEQSDASAVASAAGGARQSRAVVFDASTLIASQYQDNLALETTTDNREIAQNHSVQSLSTEDVEAMKVQGMKGELSPDAVIKTMVENHAQFDLKTEFSKQKYITRKKQKFSKIFTAIRPTAFSLCEYFFERNPSKILEMRVDMLGYMLAAADIRSNSRVLVVDDTQAMVLAGVLERSLTASPIPASAEVDTGRVLAVHSGDTDNYDMLRYLNYSKKELATTLRTVSWVDLADGANAREILAYQQAQANATTVPDADTKPALHLHRQKLRHDALTSALALANNPAGFHSLIVAATLDISSVLDHLESRLALSGMLVVYSRTREQLQAVWGRLRDGYGWKDVSITETWLREYQVLPMRTHPLMNTSGGGGYVLCARKVMEALEGEAMAEAAESNVKRTRVE